MADAAGSAVVGDVVQVNEWIGVLVESDGSVGRVRWGRPGGPFGSSETSNMPINSLLVRPQFRPTDDPDDPDVWTFR